MTLRLYGSPSDNGAIMSDRATELAQLLNDVDSFVAIKRRLDEAYTMIGHMVISDDVKEGIREFRNRKP